jgi:protein-arginine kinase activator protein McsA
MEEEVKKEETEQKQGEPTPEKPLDKMTATELREFVLNKKIEGLTGVHAMKKEELLKAIKEAMGIKEEEEAKEGKPGGGKKQASLKELKEKIFQLKRQKQEAISSEDKKKASILRRRINRLKKRSKKAVKA